MRTIVCRRGLTGHLLSLLLLTILSVNKAVAAAPAGYSEFYIPGDEDNMMYIMSTLGNLSGTQTGSGMHTIISVVASSDNTTVYYDHWEDGYDFDPNDPATTADETQTLNQGGVYTFESASIAIPRSSAVTVYDGRDRVYVAGGVPTVTRTSWVENVGPVQALSWEVYPVRPQMITYRIPFGEDLANPAGKDYQDFERVFGLIQATEDGTEITIDINNDGTPDLIDGDHDGNFDGQSITLNAGEVYRFDSSSVALYFPPLPPLNFSYDFEGGASGFTTGADIPYTDNNNSSQQFNWELGNPDTVVPANSNNCSSNCFGNGGPADCNSGNQCWGTDLDDLYINDLNDGGSGLGRVYLISPVYDFTGYSTFSSPLRSFLILREMVMIRQFCSTA